MTDVQVVKVNLASGNPMFIRREIDMEDNSELLIVHIADGDKALPSKIQADYDEATVIMKDYAEALEDTFVTGQLLRLSELGKKLVERTININNRIFAVYETGSKEYQEYNKLADSIDLYLIRQAMAQS